MASEATGIEPTARTLQQGYHQEQEGCNDKGDDSSDAGKTMHFYEVNPLTVPMRTPAPTQMIRETYKNIDQA